MRFVALLCTLVSAALVSGIAWYARFVHPFRLRIGQEVIQLPRQHSELDGLTIAFVTDTHIGPHFSTSDLVPVIDHLKELMPDILLLGGDYISESPRFMDDAARSISEMVETARFGA